MLRNKPKDLVSGSKNRDEMPRTCTTIRVPGDAEIRNQINEGGRVLAALIGNKFPVADKVWPEVYVFNWMIDGYRLSDTWVTTVSPEDREVSDDVALVFVFSYRFH